MQKRHRLILRRLELGLKQKDVAQIIGCANSVYSRYETGQRDPNVKVAQAIANALHTTVEAIFPESEINKGGKQMTLTTESNIDVFQELKSLFEQAVEQRLAELEALATTTGDIEKTPFVIEGIVRRFTLINAINIEARTRFLDRHTSQL